MSDKLEFILDEAEKRIKRLRRVLKRYAEHNCYNKPLSPYPAKDALTEDDKYE